MSYYDILLAKQLSGGGGGGDITVESLSVTANGVYSAPSGKAYSPVVANVPNTYTAGDEGKVVSSGALVAQTSQTIDTNGTYDTTLKNSVTVNVSGGGGSSNVIMGSFSFDTAGAHDITIPYNGDGYILQLYICGYGGRNIIPSTGWKNGANDVIVGKYNPDLVPDYEGNKTANQTRYVYVYGGTTSTDSLSASSSLGYSTYNDADATSSAPCVTIRSKNKLSVWVASAAGSRGFLPEVDYDYIAVYSS